MENLESNVIAWCGHERCNTRTHWFWADRKSNGAPRSWIRYARDLLRPERDEARSRYQSDTRRFRYSARRIRLYIASYAADAWYASPHQLRSLIEDETECRAYQYIARSCRGYGCALRSIERAPHLRRRLRCDRA